VIKLPKVVTHERRFAGVEAQMRAFLDAIEPARERAVLWTQLPGSFGPSDVDALARFLRRLLTNRRCAVEVRHPGFFTDAGATSQLEAHSPTPTPSGCPSTPRSSSRARRLARLSLDDLGRGGLNQRVEY
jgi:hypothetical protein